MKITEEGKRRWELMSQISWYKFQAKNNLKIARALEKELKKLDD